MGDGEEADGGGSGNVSVARGHLVSCFETLSNTEMGQKTEKIGHRVEKLLCSLSICVCV